MPAAVPASTGPQLSGAAGHPSRRAGPLLRRHWLFAALVILGLALRVAAQLAYQPALLYIDSIKYLFGAYPGNDPPGYQLLLRAFLGAGTLSEVAVVQHLAGLAMAAALYVVLLRRGVPRWLAALGTAPLLLDAYQLQIEQSIMPDTAFEVLIVAALVLLLWQPRPAFWMVLAAGAALGASATVRQVGEILIVPAVIYLLVVARGWRVKLSQAAALCVLFALPILLISYRNYVAIKHFALAPYASGTEYGRAAAAADCATLRLPAFEKPLCPTPQEQKLGPDWLDHGAGSPTKTLKLPPGKHHVAVDADFAHQVMLQQPLRVAVAVARDAIKLYAVDRVTNAGDVSIARWQFQTHYPLYPPYVAMSDGHLQFGVFTPAGQPRVLLAGARYRHTQPTVSPGLARFLRGYQLHGGYAPGPLLLLCTLAGLAGTLAVLRRRASPGQRATATACLLTFLTAVILLLASDFFEFSWRYQLPALVTLVPAGALGLAVILSVARDRRQRRGGPATAAPVPPLPRRVKTAQEVNPAQGVNAGPPPGAAAGEQDGPGRTGRTVPRQGDPARTITAGPGPTVPPRPAG